MINGSQMEYFFVVVFKATNELDWIGWLNSAQMANKIQTHSQIWRTYHCIQYN